MHSDALSIYRFIHTKRATKYKMQIILTRANSIIYKANHFTKPSPSALSNRERPISYTLDSEERRGPCHLTSRGLTSSWAAAELERIT